MKRYLAWIMLWLLVLCPLTAAAQHAGFPPPPYGTFFSVNPQGEPPVRPAPISSMRRSLLSDVDMEAMIDIPAGTFLMGADDGFADERPQRTVFVKRYLIDKYEVTNQRFRAAGLQSSQSFGNRYTFPQLPVVGVTWFQAQAYCHKMGKRLPSEIEWEKAARGADGRFFPWGNFWDPALANDGRGPQPVGSFPHGASPYGVLDMAGNVWEWVRDTYPHQKSRRILRGGGWSYAAVFMRASYRRHERPDFAEQRIGFRCAKDVP